MEVQSSALVFLFLVIKVVYELNWQTIQRTRGATNASQPSWTQKFEFEEISDGEYLKVKCYNEDIFGDENIGGARVNLEGLVDGVVRDVWIPLEKVKKGEVRLQIEAVTIDDFEGSKVCTNHVYHLGAVSFLLN